jgi:lysophospholipase L1-like esterase
MAETGGSDDPVANGAAEVGGEATGDVARREPPSEAASETAADDSAAERGVGPPSRRAKLVAIAISLFISLLLAEGVVRISGLTDAGRGAPWFAGGNHPRFLFQPDAESGYTLRPGFHGSEIARGHEFDVPVAIDARGLRDHRHTAPPRPLVLALGDSMTFGEGVDADQAWPAVLERALGVRVVDGGVPGYGSPQMRGRLHELLPALRPDLLIVALSPHWDQQRCAQPFLYRHGYIVAAGFADKLRLIDGNLYLADVRWPVVGAATVWAKRYSHLARLALPALRAAAGAVARGGRAAAGDQSGDVSATAATLVGMRGDAADAGVPMLVVFLDSRGPQYEADRDALAAALRQRRVDFVALDDLVPSEAWKPLRYPHDGHWNAAGHQRVGQLLAPRVRAMLAAPHS